MRGDEMQVVAAFGDYLVRAGCAVQFEVAKVDVAGTRGGERHYAEAKGRTGSNGGLDVDTLYGQLLRRMPKDGVGRARFAVAVPEGMIRAAQRVPPRVRTMLRIASTP